jgi:hypothetical protein
LHFEIEEIVRQRAKLAGVYIRDTSLDGSIVQIDLPENLEPEETARICLTAVHAGIVTLSPGEQTSYDLFVQYLNKLKGAALESRLRHEVHYRMISISTRIVALLKKN